MKTSSGELDPSAVNRSKAWSYLVTNLLVLPGLGSFMGKRRFTGCAQMILALLGFAITMVALCKIIMAWAQEFLLPNDPILYQAAILGIAIFLLSWIWSLATSLMFFRKKP